MDKKKRAANLLIALPSSLVRGPLVRRLPRSSNFRDRSGEERYGVRVLGYAGVLGRFTAWLCRCRCGRQFLATSAALNNDSISCGCARQKHGQSKTRLYRIWQDMISRCHRPHDSAYYRYGARGITVCRAWRNSYEQFARDMGWPPSKRHVLLRLQDEGPYAPTNCRWGTRKELGRGRSLTVTYRGETLRLDQWAKRLGLSQQAMSRRVAECRRRGASLEEVVSTPAGKHLPCVINARRR